MESEDEVEEPSEELLAAFEESLSAPGEAEPYVPACSSTAPAGYKVLGRGLVQWPLEVRLGIAAFLPWKELTSASSLCQAWHCMEREDVLWQVYFQVVWPRLARRRLAQSRGGLPWRILFQERWRRADRHEDHLEEDWLDFDAAQVLTKGPQRRAPALPESNLATEVDRALSVCREELKIPRSPATVGEVLEHLCTDRCRFRKLPVEKCEAYVCEVSGALHRCLQEQPCDLSVVSPDGFLVCPVSGRCWPKPTEGPEEAPDGAVSHDWDPSLSTGQQACRWIEQGYCMSEQEARFFFGEQRSHATRRLCGQRLRQR